MFMNFGGSIDFYVACYFTFIVRQRCAVVFRYKYTKQIMYIKTMWIKKNNKGIYKAKTYTSLSFKIKIHLGILLFIVDSFFLISLRHITFPLWPLLCVWPHSKYARMSMLWYCNVGVPVSWGCKFNNKEQILYMEENRTI